MAIPSTVTVPPGKVVPPRSVQRLSWSDTMIASSEELGSPNTASFTVSEWPLTVPVKLPEPWGVPESGLPLPPLLPPHAHASRHSPIHRFMCPLPRLSKDLASVLSLRGPRHQLDQRTPRVLPLVHDGMDLVADGQLHADLAREVARAPGGLHPLGHLRHPGEDLLQGPPLAELDPHPPVPGEVPGAGQDEVSETRQ